MNILYIIEMNLLNIIYNTSLAFEKKIGGRPWVDVWNRKIKRMKRITVANVVGEHHVHLDNPSVIIEYVFFIKFCFLNLLST